MGTCWGHRATRLQMRERSSSPERNLGDSALRQCVQPMSPEEAAPSALHPPLTPLGSPIHGSATPKFLGRRSRATVGTTSSAIMSLDTVQACNTDGLSVKLEAQPVAVPGLVRESCFFAWSHPDWSC